MFNQLNIFLWFLFAAPCFSQNLLVVENTNTHDIELLKEGKRAVYLLEGANKKKRGKVTSILDSSIVMGKDTIEISNLKMIGFRKYSNRMQTWFATGAIINASVTFPSALYSYFPELSDYSFVEILFGSNTNLGLTLLLNPEIGIVVLLPLVQWFSALVILPISLLKKTKFQIDNENYSLYIKRKGELK